MSRSTRSGASDRDGFTTAIRKKIARFRRGESLRVLDLFSGCGGLSLGFRAAGYEIAAAVEFDPDAARSHGENFHPGRPEHAAHRDITKTLPHDLTRALGLGDAPSAPFDVIVGGPPCQAFARVGRSKLREVAEHPEAFRHDERARLYIDYLAYVTACAPLAVVMENVPDMLNHAGRNIAAEVCEVLEAKGYVCGYTLLNAAFFGVPQMRERMILVAIHREAADTIVFPQPTHWITLPPGYDGARAVALKLLNSAPGDTRYHPPVEPAHDLPPAVTVDEAIGDLPEIDARRALKEGTLRRGARRFDHPLVWDGEDRLSAYGRQMRTWPNYRGSEVVTDHVIRYLPRDYSLFARMKPGDEYPQALAEAERMFEEALDRVTVERGQRPEKDDETWTELRAKIVPPYAPNKFPNKWRKLEGDQPSRTLLAHLGKDGYSHIHPSNQQARTISVREAARLQSFPDGFVFRGTMNPAFRQIGNAVPPLLAKAVGAALRDHLIAKLEVEAQSDEAGAAVGGDRG